MQGNLGFLIYNSIWCVSEGEGKLFCAAYTLYFCLQLGGPGYMRYHCQAAHKVLDGQGDANGDHAVHGPHLTRSLRTLDLLAAASEVELCCKGSFDIGSSCQTTSWYRHELMNAYIKNWTCIWLVLLKIEFKRGSNQFAFEAIGVGSTVGTGVFSITGQVARTQARS